MLGEFFHLASVSPTRRRSFRLIAFTHITLTAAIVLNKAFTGDWSGRLGLGNALLVAAIVEGALLIGWRLTQLPKSQALEFILVTDLQPSRFLLSEALVGVWRLTLVTLTGIPALALLWWAGTVTAADVGILVVMPLTWGLLTGLAITAWAYEPIEVRLWGERLMVAGVLVYLVVGVLVGENLPRWLRFFPTQVADGLLTSLLAFHEFNPFGAMRSAMLDDSPGWRAWLVSALGLGVAGLCLWRATLRLLPHFHDLHYHPVIGRDDEQRPRVGDRPLSWWAVKRVGNYSGRINLWLAGGFTIAYSAFLLAGPWWPDWLGKNVFLVFESMGGVPMLTTALVLLATVPAAFQYGLWDHNAQDRCRRLELLLLTDLDARSYWEAAFAAAWNRGRGYFALACLLWLVAWITGSFTSVQAVSAFVAGVIVWSLYFALGFWSFSTGRQANTLGLTLTLLVPVATYAASRLGYDVLAASLPPGSVFFARTETLIWAIGPALTGVVTLIVARRTLGRCDGALRQWYDRNHGVRVVD